MIKRALTAPIRLYRRYLSPLKRQPTCRYLPTCSSYALEAIETRGVVVGTLKAVWRLLRCNPLFKGGYDPVERTASAPAACAHHALEAGAACTEQDV